MKSGRWTAKEEKKLIELLRSDYTTYGCANKLNRTEASVRDKKAKLKRAGKLNANYKLTEKQAIKIVIEILQKRLLDD